MALLGGVVLGKAFCEGRVEVMQKRKRETRDDSYVTSGKEGGHMDWKYDLIPFPCLTVALVTTVTPNA